MCKISLRYSRSLGIAALLLGVWISPSPGQDATKKTRDTTPRDEVVTTADRRKIYLTYFPSTAGKNAPVAILLHNRGGNRLVWGSPPDYKSGFAKQLQDSGFAVAAVDLRRHGESKVTSKTKKSKSSKGSANLTKRDYIGMGADLEAVKKFLLSEHQEGNLNIRKTAIVAAEMTAPIALSYAAFDWAKVPYEDAPILAACTPRGQDIRSVILLSPEANVPGITSAKSVASLRIPQKRFSVLICVGANDRKGKADAKKLYDQFASNVANKKRIYLRNSYKTNARGTNLISGAGRQASVEESMFSFLKRHKEELKFVEWADRRPRYNRDDDK